jgi:ribosomal protein S18 acetylase RimI-like enzyme
MALAGGESGTGLRVVRIRDHDPKLLEGLDRLHRAFFEGAAAEPERFMDFVSGRLGDEAMLLILAVAGDVPIGYGLAFDVAEHPFMPEWQHAGYITQLYVSPGQRRRGIGRLLVDQIMAWLASRDVAEVLLNVVPGEAVAERFWREQGFLPCRIRMRRRI